MTMTIDLATQTPVEIDTALAAIYERFYIARSRAESCATDLKYAKQRLARTTGTRVEFAQQGVAQMEARLEAAKQKAQAILAECDPFDAEFDRRGGWTRAWKVTNVGGHIHKTMHCQTCFATTSFAWLPQVSGHPEAEIVELAASAACTVCYPTAPVDRPTRLFTKAEQEAKAERQAKAKAKIERERKRLAKALLPSGEPLIVTTGSRWPERLATLVAARTWLTDSYFWGHGHPSYPPHAVLQVAEAVAAKEGKSAETVLAEAAKRAAKRK